MINTWFTSDHHFGHKNILEYEKETRPFSCVEEMNEVMIDRWNSVVKDNDIVYHLGDFCFGKCNIDIAGRLRGKKRLVLGNHDVYPCTSYLNYFDRVYGAFYWKLCVLTHIPVHTNNLGSRAMLNLHGHLHSKKVIENYMKMDGLLICALKPIYDENYFNVSVEQNNLTPIHADVIFDRLKNLS